MTPRQRIEADQDRQTRAMAKYYRLKERIAPIPNDRLHQIAAVVGYRDRYAPWGFRLDLAMYILDSPSPDFMLELLQ